MKFALVTETFPPEVNGVSMTLGRLCDGLAKRGWNVQVARPVQEHEELDCPSVESDFEEIVIPGIPLPGYSSLRMGEPGIFSLHRSWKAERPDIVHIATEGPLGLAALAVAYFLKLPVSSTFHTNFDQYTGHYRVGFIQHGLAWYLKSVHNRCGCTLAPTRQMAEVLADNGYLNTGVMSRGVDTKNFNPNHRDETLRSSWGVKGTGRVWLYVGRVAKEKNIELAFKAFEAVRASSPQDRMVVVGDGPELVGLKRLYPEVNYAGMRKGEDLARHYASGDIFIFPSVTETFGNVVTEAMASGLATLTYDYAAGREFIEDGKNGYLAGFDCSDAFVRKAQEVGRVSHSDLAKVGEAARETAEAISWERVVEAFEHSVRAVIARHRVAFCD